MHSDFLERPFLATRRSCEVPRGILNVPVQHPEDWTMNTMPNPLGASIGELILILQTRDSLVPAWWSILCSPWYYLYTSSICNRIPFWNGIFACFWRGNYRNLTRISLFRLLGNFWGLSKVDFRVFQEKLDRTMYFYIFSQHFFCEKNPSIEDVGSMDGGGQAIICLL